MGDRLDRERWALVAKKPPAIPSRNGELAWIGTRLEQMEDSQELLTYEVVRIVGNSDLIARLISQFQEDAQFRRRWEHTEFIFMSSYWEIDGDDDHWYSMGIQTREMEFIDVHGLVYPTPMPASHIELRWTFWMDGMTPSDSEEAARKLKE